MPKRWPIKKALPLIGALMIPHAAVFAAHISSAYWGRIDGLLTTADQRHEARLRIVEAMHPRYADLNPYRDESAIWDKLSSEALEEAGVTTLEKALDVFDKAIELASKP